MRETTKRAGELAAENFRAVAVEAGIHGVMDAADLYPGDDLQWLRRLWRGINVQTMGSFALAAHVLKLKVKDFDGRDPVAVISEAVAGYESTSAFARDTDFGACSANRIRHGRNVSLGPMARRVLTLLRHAGAEISDIFDGYDYQKCIDENCHFGAG